MQARPYQQTAVDSIKLNQVNLCVLPMRKHTLSKTCV